MIHRLSLFALLFIWMAPFAGAQVQVLAERDGESLPVVAMDGDYPIVSVDGERVRIYDSKMTIAPAQYYTDGSIQIVSKDAAMGPDYGSSYGSFFFSFIAAINADRDFEDCFILFSIRPSDGQETIIMREIPDISAEGTDRVSIKVPVNPGFGGGGFGYYLFSQGEQIEVNDPERKISIRQEDGSESVSSTNEPDPSSRNRTTMSRSVQRPRFLDAKFPNFPESLIGKNVSGLATVMFTIGIEGNVIEVIDMVSDHGAFLIEARRSLLESSFRPAIVEDEPLTTTVQQVISFNEYVVFPEELEMVPYPRLGDRDAMLVYRELPSLEDLGKLSAEERTVTVELMVNPLGIASSVRVVEAANDQVADRVAGAVPDWIFLPAVRGGYPTTSEIRLPISY